MGEIVKYRTFTVYDGQSMQLDGTLSTDKRDTPLDIWSTGDGDVPADTAEQARAAWEKGEVLVTNYGNVNSLVVPVEPLTLVAVEQAIRRFRPDATTVDLSDLQQDME
ncbi:MAG TPA: hypothetical protein VK694_06005 [Verrucomicrobiae bacterium]|nr:hypothetical protein [Verrucomicrobiae bacterium]